ncbi:MAG: succinate dehydrogenase, cytochrome b556 subunit [Chloroflexi bacterium]|nr:succinate dehydrogenase, cytochrome b556 subunit [Chloroflexota bacterium]
MTTLVTTISETLRYRGKIGQWSWALHRLAGLGVVLFLVLHVIDTSWAAFYPEQYAKAIAEYQSPLFTVGEFVLVAALVYHAINGLRIAYLDYQPHLWRYQRQAAYIVFGVTVLILIPTFAVMGSHVADFWEGDPEVPGIVDIAETQVQFLIGFIVIVAAALVLSFLVSLVFRESEHGDKSPRRPSQIDVWLWSFMRWSGVLILPLVFGHILMIHMIGSVFEITAADATVVGTTAANDTGTAVEFVGERWDHLVAGVAVWRLYDGALLALVVIHGFNGLRYVINDYFHGRVVNRALNWVVLFGGAALIILGMAALIAGVEEAAYEIALDKSGLRDAAITWLGG